MAHSRSLKRRWRRFLRRHPRLKAALPSLRKLLVLCAVLLVCIAAFLFFSRLYYKQDVPKTLPTVAPTAEPTATPTSVPTENPVAAAMSAILESPTENPVAVSMAQLTESSPAATPMAEAPIAPLPTLAPLATQPPKIDGVLLEYYTQPAKTPADYSNPATNGLLITRVYENGVQNDNYQRTDPIAMPAGSQYAQVEGVVTFRGSNYRDGASYGTIPENPSSLDVVWTKGIGRLDEWGGVGWTGQASAIRWSDELRQAMNINAEKKAKSGLVEVLYGTLDGHIYFLDLDDGKPTRDPIDIGAPIKGSLSVDPRGIPLLYCGQGIYDVEGKRVECGTRIWSLIDQSLLHMINGKDEYAVRPWRAFDSSPLVDAASDTLIQCGENGVLYTLKLNTVYENGKVSISPKTDRYVYKQSIDGQVGTENSLAVYDHYAYFGNNVGIIQCVDLNTMKLVWSFNAQDDIDASLVIEVEEDGTVALYGANEQDKRGSTGHSQMFKLDALSGEVLWFRDSALIYQNNDNGGGSFATPCVGKNDLSELVYFHICRTKGSGAVLYALNKETGEIVWEREMGRYGWMSPTTVYTPGGKGYLLIGSANGMLRLLDGLTGDQIASVDLEYNIEASPVVFDDMIVIGTRGAKIHGIRIS